MVLKTAAKLTCLNRLLACVPIESAFGYSQVFCGLGVLQPGIEIRLGGNCWRDGGAFGDLISNSRQRFPQHLNEMVGIPRLEHHAGHNSWFTDLSLSVCISSVVHPASVRSNLDSQLTSSHGRFGPNALRPGEPVARSQVVLS